MPDDFTTLQALLTALAPHYSQRRLARVLGVAPVTLRRWQRGTHQPPPYRLQWAISQVEALVTRGDITTDTEESS